MRANAQEIDFFDPAHDDQRFDVIVMYEVIEHVPQPPRFLARGFSLLAPGGLLYATTPNFTASPGAWSVPTGAPFTPSTSRTS